MWNRARAGPALRGFPAAHRVAGVFLVRLVLARLVLARLERADREQADRARVFPDRAGPVRADPDRAVPVARDRGFGVGLWDMGMADHADRLHIARHGGGGPQRGAGRGRDAKEGFTGEIQRIGDRDKGHGRKAVFDGKGFGLGQGFSGDGGDMGVVAVHRPVIGQIMHVVGCGPVQREGDALFAHDLVRQKAGLDGQVTDLFIGQHQFAQQARGVDFLCGVAQGRQGGGQVGRIQRDIAHKVPARRHAVQQADAVKRQGQGKIRFHRARFNTGRSAREAGRIGAGILGQVVAQ